MDKIYELIIVDFLKYLQKHNIDISYIDEEDIKIFIRDRYLNGIRVYLETDYCQEPGCLEIIENRYKYCSKHQQKSKKIKKLLKEYQLELENSY